MRTGLTKREKTTDIWFDEKDPLIHIRTHNTALKKRLLAYIDDISRNVLYLKIHDVLIICALDSFNFFNLQYQEEVHILDSLEIVHPLQGLELFAKMVYYKTHYKFDTEHKVIIDASGPYIENKIINATQIRPFNLKELYDLMKNVLQLRGVTDEIPEYVEGKMFSFIPRKV